MKGSNMANMGLADFALPPSPKLATKVSSPIGPLPPEADYQGPLSKY